MRIQVTGVEEVRARLAAMGPNAQAAFEEGVAAELARTMRFAQRLVPVYSGDLRSSAFVDQKRDAHKTAWSFGYRSPYAAFVHEHPNAHTNADGHPCACYATIHRPRPGMLRNGEGYRWLSRAVEQSKLDVGAVFRRVRNAVLIATGQRNANRPAPPPVPHAGAAVGRRRSSEGGGGGGALGGYLRALLKLAAKGGR